MSSESTIASSLEFWVPQGSVLGSMLYVLYAQYLGALLESKNSYVYNYADDTQLYKSL